MREIRTLRVWACKALARDPAFAFAVEELGAMIVALALIERDARSVSTFVTPCERSRSGTTANVCWEPPHVPRRNKDE